MRIRDLLLNIQELAKKANLSEPFLCGGVVRDKLANRLESVEDLDITTGDDSVHKLAKAVADQLTSQGGYYKVLDDGHAQITFGQLKIDFSSNYRAPQAERLLKQAGVKDPTDMQLELYSRDFTINCLLMSLDLKTIKDPTGLGINDLKRKRIRTPLPAKFTLENDNKRIIRIIYMAAKLGFDVDKEIIDWVTENPGKIANVKPRYLSDRLQKAIDFDLDKTTQLLTDMKLWPYVPILPALESYARSHPEIL